MDGGLLGTRNKQRPRLWPGLALTGILLLSSILIAVVPSMQASELGPLSSSRTSGNGCDCHGTNYNEYIRIDNYTIPSQLLVGQSLQVYTNITMYSTKYNASKSSYWLSDITVTVTSLQGLNTVIGSPKTDNSKLPTFQKEYSFTIKGASGGTDTIKIEAKLRTHHYGRTVSDSVQGTVLVIKPKEAPVLSNGKVSPAMSTNLSKFTYRVTYSDGDGDLPTSIGVIIDGGAPRTMVLADGIANTILTGEDYLLDVMGTALGVGNHTFAFKATDNLFTAIGDNWTHQGPKVTAYVAPNKPPTVTITYPTSGATVIGAVNVTGTAVDPDTGDVVDKVEVNLDNGLWSKANGTTTWHIIWDCSNISSGDHTFYARATDGKNYSNPVAMNVIIERRVIGPPTVAITDYSYVAENILEVRGTSAKGNNSDPVDLVHLWFDPVGYWIPAERKGPPLGNGTPSYDVWTWSWNTSELDPISFSLTARAWAGNLVSTMVTTDLTVRKFNHPPIITLTGPEIATTMYEGDSKAFWVQAVDQDADPLTYLWYIDNTSKAITGDPTTLTYKASYTSSGPHQVRIEVSDGNDENGTTTFTWDLTVLDGFVVTDKTDLGDSLLESGEAQELGVSVLDPEGQPIRYTWTVDGQRDDCAIGPTYRFAHESSTTATTKHTIALKVTNSKGMTKDLSWAVDVKGVPDAGGGGHGNGGGKGQMGPAASAAIYGLGALAILTCIYMAYACLRSGKQVPDETASDGAAFEASPTIEPEQSHIVDPGPQYPPYYEAQSGCDYQDPSQQQGRNGGIG